MQPNNYGNPFYPPGYNGQSTQNSHQNIQQIPNGQPSQNVQRIGQQYSHAAQSAGQPYENVAPSMQQMALRQQQTQAVSTTAPFPAVRRFTAGQYYQPQMYANMGHAAQMNNLAMQHPDFHDRNDSKPRLAKPEVELLERHFQENHKPPSSLKRQLAEGMGVQVSRINNWFQNRRAKAKHEKKLESVRVKAEAADAGAEATTTEDYDFSEDFLEMYNDDDDEPAQEETPQISNKSTPSSSETVLDGVQEDSVVPRNASEMKREAHGLTDFTFFGQDELHTFEAPFISTQGCDTALFPITATSTSMPNINRFQFGCFQPSIDVYSGDLAVNQQQHQQDCSVSPEIHTTSDSTAPFPSQALNDYQRRGSYQSSSTELGQTAVMESVKEEQTMRFMSPPPASDLASRRSKRRPAPIGTAAIADRSTSGARTPLTAAIPRRGAKSPGAAIRRVASVGNMNLNRIAKSAAQSPMRQHFPHELRKFSGMHGQVNLVQPANGGLAPPTPKSPTYKFGVDELVQMLPATYEHETDSMGTFDSSSPSFNQYGFGFSPPETPGYMANNYAWSGFDGADGTSYTPGLGAFPSDPFSLHLQQTEQVPGYVSGNGAYDINHNLHATSIEAYQAQMHITQQYLSPQSTEASVSSLSSCNSSDFLNGKFEAQNAEPNNQVQYQWEQQTSNFVAPVLSSPELPAKNQTLVFHNATPKDFQGKKFPASETLDA